METCPKCGGEIYNNLPGKAEGRLNPKMPDKKCKDPTCGWILWPPKTKGAPKAAAVDRGPRWTWATLSKTYERCLLLAEKHLVASSKRTKIGFLTADLASVAACLFIAASRDGVSEPTPAPVTETDDNGSDVPF